VVPLKVNIAPIELKIVKAQKQKNPCEGRLPIPWEVELEPIQQKEFFDIEPIPKRAAESPFDVCVIYPAVTFARPIQRERLTKDMLPKQVAMNTVAAAIDLTNDQKPDVFIIQYCCADPTKPPEGCDYTCGKIFKKSDNTWIVIDTWEPC
jgi:hypothetical protein